MDLIRQGTEFDLYIHEGHYLITLAGNPAEVVWRYPVSKTREAFAWWNLLHRPARYGPVVAKRKRP